MANLDNDFDKRDIDDENAEPGTSANKKKVLLFLIPALIAIGIVVSFLAATSRDISSNKSYSVVSKADDEGKGVSTIIFYDLPEVNVQLSQQNPKEPPEVLKVRLNIELSSEADVPIIEALMSRITDAIISHTMELTSQEVSGIENLQWLREELLYRMNLVASPVKISNINFKSFEIQKNS